jgi:uncharacterized protein (DUF2141 family)
MSRIPSAVLLASAAWAGLGSPANTQERPGPAACGSGAGTSVITHVTGLKAGSGTVRVQAYGPNPATFLQKHRWVARAEARSAGRQSVDLCLSLPTPGRYAIAVRHDVNNSGSSDWGDGGGFSRNPRLSLFHLRPAFDDVAVPVRAGTPTRVDVVVLYRRGLTLGPAKPGD